MQTIFKIALFIMLSVAVCAKQDNNASLAQNTTNTSLAQNTTLDNITNQEIINTLIDAEILAKANAEVVETTEIIINSTEEGAETDEIEIFNTVFIRNLVAQPSINGGAFHYTVAEPFHFNIPVPVPVLVPVKNCNEVTEVAEQQPVQCCEDEEEQPEQCCESEEEQSEECCEEEQSEQYCEEEQQENLVLVEKDLNITIIQEDGDKVKVEEKTVGDKSSLKVTTTDAEQPDYVRSEDQDDHNDDSVVYIKDEVIEIEPITADDDEVEVDYIREPLVVLDEEPSLTIIEDRDSIIIDSKPDHYYADEYVKDEVDDLREPEIDIVDNFADVIEEPRLIVEDIVSDYEDKRDVVVQQAPRKRFIRSPARDN